MESGRISMDILSDFLWKLVIHPISHAVCRIFNKNRIRYAIIHALEKEGADEGMYENFEINIPKVRSAAAQYQGMYQTLAECAARTGRERNGIFGEHRG